MRGKLITTVHIIAFYIDWGIGGTDDSSDDTGDYDTVLDIAWAWDCDGNGTPGNWHRSVLLVLHFLRVRVLMMMLLIMMRMD